MLYFTIQNRFQDGTSKVPEAAGARWRFYPRIMLGYRRISSNRFSIGGSTSGSFRSNLELQDFVAGAVFGEVGGWLHFLRALEMTFHMSCRSLMTFILRGRRSIWWCWRVTLLAPRIGNDVSYVTQISDDIHFAWQAHYLVKCESDFSWQAQHFVTFWEIAGTRNVVFLRYKIVSKMGRVRSPKRRVRDDDFILGLCSDIVGYRRIVFLLAEALQGVSGQILSFKISWQAQYLVRLEGDFTCSAHWKWRFICHADQRWHSFSVAGALFGAVGGWLYLFHTLEMTFHMWRRSTMTFILRGRRSIWWGWRVTSLSPRIGNEVSYVMQIIDDVHFAWQAQYLVMLEGDFTCSTHWKWRFICDADHWWHSFCVAGAVFGEVGRWFLLRRALQMTFQSSTGGASTF